MPLAIRYTDKSWEYPRGIRVAQEECSGRVHVSAREVADRIQRDDPLRCVDPIVHLLLDIASDGLIDLLDLSDEELDSTRFTLSEASVIEVVVERKSGSKLPRMNDTVVPPPVVLEVRQEQVGPLVVSLPTPARQRSRARGVMASPTRETEEGGVCGAMGLRYFDDEVQGFVRIPHGGQVPAVGMVRVAIELTPHPSSFAVEFGEGSLQRVVSNDSVVKQQNEEDVLDEVYTKHLSEGNEKAAIRNGVPARRKQAFYRTLLVSSAPFEEQKRREEMGSAAQQSLDYSAKALVYDLATVEEAYRKDFEDTFKWDDLNTAHPTFVPFAPTFGAKRIDSGYHQLIPEQERSVKIILSMVASRLPCLQYFPMLPAIACFLTHHLVPPEAYAALLHIMDDTSKGKSKYNFPCDSAGLAAAMTGLIKQKLPDVYHRFCTGAAYQQSASPGEALGAITVHWMEDVFTSVLPLYMSARVFDIYVREGVSIFFKMALALLDTLDEILKTNWHLRRRCLEDRFKEVLPLVKDEARLFAKAFEYSSPVASIGKLGGKSNGRCDVSMTGTVLWRPGFAEVADVSGEGRSRKSTIVADPQLWEYLFSWMPSTVLRGSLLKVYEKKIDGASLITVRSRCEQYVNPPTLVLFHLIPAIPEKDSKDPRTPSRATEVVGYFLSHGIVYHHKPVGDATSFPFYLKPAPVRLSSEGISAHCHFTSMSSLCFGESRGHSFLSFNDTDKGVADPFACDASQKLKASEWDGEASSMGLSAGSRGDVDDSLDGSLCQVDYSSKKSYRPPGLHPVCDGKFYVLNMEIFVIV
ncbi:RabGTPase-activating protein [Diplonema papillatum]|nr:RabGTPase-activating protein [Diplonema papillatum]